MSAKVPIMKSVAVVVNGQLVIYGSGGRDDITRVDANAYGNVNLADLSRHHDAGFTTRPGEREKKYASLQTAADLFNAASTYSSLNPKADKLLVIEAGNASGSTLPPHKAHDLGRALDIRYQSSKGRKLQGDYVANQAGVYNTSTLILIARMHGFDQNYTSRPADFGGEFRKNHHHHYHMGKSRPQAMQERNRPR